MPADAFRRGNGSPVGNGGVAQRDGFAQRLRGALDPLARPGIDENMRQMRIGFVDATGSATTAAKAVQFTVPILAKARAKRSSSAVGPGAESF